MGASPSPSSPAAANLAPRYDIKVSKEMTKGQQSKRRRLDVMRYIDIAAAEIDDDADLDEEDAEFVSAQGSDVRTSTDKSDNDRLERTDVDAFNIPTFLEREKAELDRDHLEDIARSFRERAKKDLHNSIDLDEAVDSDNEETSISHFTSNFFNSERIKHLAGDQKAWMLPLKRALSAADRRLLRKRIRVSTDLVQTSYLSSEFVQTSARSEVNYRLQMARVFTFNVPRHPDVIYLCAPDLETVHKVFQGIMSVDLPRAKFVPEEELHQLYEWSQKDKNVIPGLIQHQFVRIRKQGIFGQDDLRQYAGDLAFVVDILHDPNDVNRNRILLVLIPRIYYKGDNINVIGMLPVQKDFVDRMTMTEDLIAQPESPKSGSGKALSTNTIISDQEPRNLLRDVGLCTDSSIVHYVGVQTGGDLGMFRDANVQAYDLSALDVELSAIYVRPSVLDPANPSPSTRTYRTVSCGHGPPKGGDFCREEQAHFGPSETDASPSPPRPRAPQRLFLPELIEQQYPGELETVRGGQFEFRGRSYLNEELMVQLTGYESIVRAWPTPEEAWMFVEERLGVALVVNMAYLRVGDIVALYESRDIFKRLHHPEMTGTVRDISFLEVKVEVDGLAGIVQHRIDRLWRVFRTGTWVEDMMVKKGQIGFVLQSHPDDSIDICYWNDKGAIEQYTSYAWYFRTTDPPMFSASLVSESGKKKPLIVPKPKLEPFCVELRRQWRNFFVGKDVYIFDGQLKGRIGKVLGIGERTALVVFDAHPEKHKVNIAAAVNILSMLRLDGTDLPDDTLTECQQAVQYLLENPYPECEADPSGANATDVTVAKRPSTPGNEVGHRSSDHPIPGDMHWLMDPLVNRHFATHKIFARFLPDHQRAGQLVWTFSNTRTHISTVTLDGQSKLGLNLDMEYTSKNFGVAQRERVCPSDVVVANPMVSCLALVVSGAHRGKFCVVKSIIRDPQKKAAIAFKVKFDGTKRGQVVDIAISEITRAELLPASTPT